MILSEFQQHLILSTVPIRKFADTLLPSGIASACIATYEGKRVLLTVQHATGDMGDWGIQCRFEPGKGTAVWRLGPMCFLTRLSISNAEVKDIDFAYVEVPETLRITDQHINPKTGKIEVETERIVCNLDFRIHPDKGREYGFSGHVLPAMQADKLLTELRVYTGLRYVGDQDDYYKFALPMKYPGHEQFRGCSGAPIMDMDGNVVALVCKGNVTENAIYGIALRRYETALSASYGKLGGMSSGGGSTPPN